MSDSTGEDIPHDLRRFQLRVGGDVGVGVQREACGVVTQHTADGLHVHAVLEREDGEGMAEVVKADVGQSGSFQHPLEHIPLGQCPCHTPKKVTQRLTRAKRLYFSMTAAG